MEKPIIEALRTNNTVFINLIEYLKIDKIAISDFVNKPSAAEHMNLFIAFFTRFYNLEIKCRSNGFEATKSNAIVVSISADGNYTELFMVFITLLIQYCEKPF